MSTLRRILKYTPAMLLGLLVASWISCKFGFSQCTMHLGPNSLTAQWIGGSLLMHTARTGEPGIGYVRFDPPRKGLPPLGRLRFSSRYGYFRLEVPLPIAAVAILPLAVGPFLSFSFRLWQCLAYTALIALELSYYLQWQK